MADPIQSSFPFDPFIISRDQAIAFGLKRYFTGKPCRYGHISERLVLSKYCIACHNEQKRQRYAEEPEKFLTRNRATYHRNKTKVKLKRKLQTLAREAEWSQAQHKEKCAKDSARHQRRHREKRDAAAARPKPDHCEVCKQKSDRICFDHSHETGRFRGWPCDRCNKTLGLVKDSPELLERLAAYLRAHENQIALTEAQPAAATNGNGSEAGAEAQA